MSSIWSDQFPSSTLGECLSRVQRVGRSQGVSGDCNLNHTFMEKSLRKKKRSYITPEEQERQGEQKGEGVIDTE